MEVQVKITTKELKKELESRGFHVIPRRCSGCGGNHPLEFCETLKALTCGNPDCRKLERECNCN